MPPILRHCSRRNSGVVLLATITPKAGGVVPVPRHRILHYATISFVRWRAGTHHHRVLFGA
jgi:hypothetical protein